MSFSELLEAVKALPREEKQQIIEALREEDPKPSLLDSLAVHYPPGSTVHSGWRITTDAAGMESLQNFVNNMQASK